MTKWIHGLFLSLIVTAAVMLAQIVKPQFVFAAAADGNEESLGQSVEVEKIKEKYWAKGNETELGVVQNRLYSNAGKFELGGFGGIVSSDPFLSVSSLGGSIGYYLNQYFAIHGLGWKAYTSSSAALKTFQSETSFTANTNNPKSFYGLQASGDFLYGKLSLVGKMIIYFDLHLRLGAGYTQTESGNDFTQFIGLGQQIHLDKNFSLALDYRLMRYREDIIGKIPGVGFGSVVDQRTNLTDVVTLGVTYMFGT